MSLKYDERLKRIPMMTRGNNVAMRESNDNIDHSDPTSSEAYFLGIYQCFTFRLIYAIE